MNEKYCTMKNSDKNNQHFDMLSFNFLKKTINLSSLQNEFIDRGNHKTNRVVFLTSFVFFSLINKSGLELRSVLNFFNLDSDKLLVCLVHPCFWGWFLFLPLWHSLSAGEFMTRQFECYKQFLLTQLCLGRFKTE